MQHTYSEAIQWLFTQFPNYQIQGNKAYKPGLNTILSLAQLFKNPQQNFKSIHIAGTNGKGSTSHMLASILQESGYKVGLFTSPHLKNFTERIKINGKEAPKDFVYDFIHKIKQLSLPFNPSFFEITTLMAFYYFAQEKVNIAIIETGLGGRLDSTNISNPIISVITSISFDHQDILGYTLEEITLEKCGIIKEKTPIIDGELNPKPKKIIKNYALLKHSKYINACSYKISYKTDLLGDYQELNKKTVLATLIELQNQGWNISEENIKKGFLNVIKNTQIRGRWEIFNTKPLVILDIAHNEEGFKQVLLQLKKYKKRKKKFILGFIKGKNIENIIKLLPKDAEYYFVKPSINKALNPLDYKDIVEKQQLVATYFNSVLEGYNYVLHISKKEDLIFISGSNFVIADLI